MALPIPQSLYNPRAATAAERRVLASVTSDPLEVGPIATPNGFDFVDGGVGNDQIVRSDGGSWLDDGFLVGKTVTVANATTVANNGAYTILAATADTLDVATASLTADTDDNTATFTTTGVGSGVTGHKTRNHKYLHVTLLSRIGTSFDATLYVRPAFSDEWAVASWWGTNGTVTVTTASGPVVTEPLLIAGIDEAFVHAHTFVGTGEEADAWLAGSTPEAS